MGLLLIRVTGVRDRLRRMKEKETIRALLKLCIDYEQALQAAREYFEALRRVEPALVSQEDWDLVQRNPAIRERAEAKFSEALHSLDLQETVEILSKLPKPQYLN